MVTATETTDIDTHLLNPALADKHKRSRDWHSAALFWKRELDFFQSLLDQCSPKITSIEEKKKIAHFQNLIIYYNGEVVDLLISKLHDDEKNLAHKASEGNGETDFIEAHERLMEEVESFNRHYKNHKEELFEFFERRL